MSRRPEQRLWDRLRKVAANKLHAERIENLVGVGRPDVDTLIAGNFVPLELKQIDNWPKRTTTSVLGQKGLSQVQKNWHLNWRRWGGRSMIVVGVKLEVFSFEGALADSINNFTREDFETQAVARGLEALVEFLMEEAYDKYCRLVD